MLVQAERMLKVAVDPFLGKSSGRFDHYMGTQYYLLPALIGSIVVVVAIMLVTHPRTIRTYWQRSCTGRAWKRAFPRASKDEIRNFLHLFVDAFAFPRKRALQFAPTDQVLSVYRALYPVKGWPDALELETFALRVEKTYGVALRSIWRDDLTMGEIFEKSLPEHSWIADDGNAGGIILANWIGQNIARRTCRLISSRRRPVDQACRQATA